MDYLLLSLGLLKIGSLAKRISSIELDICRQSKGISGIYEEVFISKRSILLSLSEVIKCIIKKVILLSSPPKVKYNKPNHVCLEKDRILKILSCSLEYI